MRDYDYILRLADQIEEKEKEIAHWRNNLEIAQRELKELTARVDKHFEAKQ